MAYERARATGRMLSTMGGAAAGGLVPALALDPATENIDFIKEKYWAYPLLMLLVGGLVSWKGKAWMQPIGYGMLGAAAFAFYRGYKAEAGAYGYGPGYDAASAGQFAPGTVPAGALPYNVNGWYPYQTVYEGQVVS